MAVKEVFETHLLRKLDDLKELPPGSLLVKLDVSSLYTNIPHKEGIEACRKGLNSSGHLSRSRLKTESICDLMRMILTMNNFEFDNNHFIQLHGTAMGTRMATAYANLCMGDLEEKLLAQFPLKPYLWWRYIFMVWTHGEDKLEDFINHINSLYSTIKFTYEFSKSHISFLDVTVSLDNNNKISTDLFVKSTDTHQYLLHISCHPSHIRKSIPFNPALRIRRICSSTEKFQQRTNELLEFLCKRGHGRQYVQSQINKAFQIPRRDTLFYKSKTRNTDRPVFVTTYNPSLPNLNNVIKSTILSLLLQSAVKKHSKIPHFLHTDVQKTFVTSSSKPDLKNNHLQITPTLPKELHSAMMAVVVPVSSSLMAHHLILSTIL